MHCEARIGSFVWIGSLPMRRFCCGKKSMAKCTPRVRGREFEITRLFGAAGKNDRVKTFEQGGSIEIDPDIQPLWKCTPSACIWTMRRSITCFSILKSGMP